MLQYTSTGGSSRSSLAIVTIDSPKIVLAIDPLAAMLDFAMSPFKKSSPEKALPEDEEEDEPSQQEESSQGGGMAFRVEVIDPTILVLADDTDAKTQAIQLAVHEILMAHGNIVAITIGKFGMSFGRMDRPNDRVRFLDDLNISLSMDKRRQGLQQKTSLQLDIPDPIIFRASYSDIMLISDIGNKAWQAASAVMDGGAAAKPNGHGARQDGATDTISASSLSAPARPNVRRSSAAARRTSMSARRSSISGRRGSLERSRAIVSREEASAGYEIY